MNCQKSNFLFMKCKVNFLIIFNEPLHLKHSILVYKRGFSFKRNCTCVLRRWESEILKQIVNHKVNKVN